MIERIFSALLWATFGAVLAYGYIQGLLWEFLTVSTYMPNDSEEIYRVVRAERTQFIGAGTVIYGALALSGLVNCFFIARKIGQGRNRHG